MPAGAHSYELIFDLRMSGIFGPSYWSVLGPVSIPFFLGLLGLVLCRHSEFRDGLQTIMRPNFFPLEVLFGFLVVFGFLVFGGLASGVITRHFVLLRAEEAGACKILEGTAEDLTIVQTSATNRRIKFRVSGVWFSFRDKELQPGYADAYEIRPNDSLRIKHCEVDPTQIIRLEKWQGSRSIH